MCGIAGIIDFRGRPVSPARLGLCCDRLAHRGPDDRGTWLGHTPAFSIGLAHTRLAVIDPKPEGRQPMFDSQDRFVIVFNGTIYNYRELRNELSAEGCSFRTETDTEVILNGYSRWGWRVLERLNGMWAFCLVDTRDGVGFLVRDRFGIKPLIYSVSEDELGFASEMGAWEALTNSALNVRPAGVHHYLRYGYIAQPHTIYEGCHRLLPGCLLHFDRSGAGRPQRYYRLQPDDQLAGLSYPEACQELRARIGRSVKLRTVSDVPLGAFLSGGLDSSIIVSHLASDTSARPHTFSIAFADQPRYDESRYARLVARHFGTDHHELDLRFDDVIKHLPVMLNHLAEPFADASLIPVSLLSGHARRGVTVALSGDAADELFGGYDRYVGHHLLQRYRRLPRLLRRRLIEPLLAVLPASKSNWLGNRVRQARKLLRSQAENELERHLMWSRSLSPQAELLLDPNRHMPCVSSAESILEEVLGPDLVRFWSHDPLNLILLLDLHYQLPADMLHKVDLASMYYGLEVRVPMLDPAVVELAASMSSAFKLQGRTAKRILRDAYRDVLPSEILARKKMGFELPIGEFLRHGLRDMFFDVVSPRTIEALPPLSFQGVMELYREHVERRAEHADILYALLVLCFWKSARSAAHRPVY